MIATQSATTQSHTVVPEVRPIFIIGTERSGSNLLRLILNSHSSISIPHPPHVMRYFTPLASHYGNLQIDKNFNRLARDVAYLINHHIYPWPFTVHANTLALQACEPSVFGLCAAAYEQYRDFHGKARWGNKSTFLIDNTDAIFHLYPQAQLIWLVRDPRDVAASSVTSVFNPFHPYYTVQLWNRQQLRGMQLIESLPKHALFLLRYEDLIQSPEESVRELCTFLDEKFEPEMLQFFTKEEASLSASLSQSWQNTSSTILHDNAGKYRKKLKVNDIKLVETMCRPLMQSFGYATEKHIPEPHPSVDIISNSARNLFRLATYALNNIVARVKVEYMSVRQDANVWKRWHRALFMCYLQLLRRGV